MSKQSKQAFYIGNELKLIRKALKINQSEMADQLGIKRSRLGSYEEGRAMPDIEMFLKICKTYDRDPFSFLEPLSKLQDGE